MSIDIGMQYGCDYPTSTAHTWTVVAVGPDLIVVERNDGALIHHKPDFVEMRLKENPNPDGTWYTYD